MVLVVFFAVFLGTWSPVSLNVGYSNFQEAPKNIHMHTLINKLDSVSLIGPKIQDATTGESYSTPNGETFSVLICGCITFLSQS